MTTLTFDESALSVLRQVKGLAEIRDAAGNTIGFFAPVAVEQSQKLVQAAARFDRDEIKRRKDRETGGYTTREVFEHLRKLTTDPAVQADLDAKIAVLQERDGCGTP